MLKAPSLQHEYSLVFSEDPALDLPVVPELADDASDADREAHDEIVKLREAKLRAARETGRWGELCHDGAEPTIFKVAPIGGMALTWFQGEVRRLQLEREQALELAFRLALRGVTNLGKLEAKTVLEDGRRLASPATIDALYAIGGDADPMLGRRLVFELGGVVLQRAIGGLSPP